MSRHKASLRPDYFARLYASDPDPWRFASSDYERGKYAATLAALGKERYRAGLEIGCSIGVLTSQLAQRCDSLIAVDVSAAALDHARARCAGMPGLTFATAMVPGTWPSGQFDLILLSEIIYYLDRNDLGRLVDRVRGSLASDGEVVLVHWTGETDYPLSGDEAARSFIAQSADFADIVRELRTEHYRLDVLRGRHT